MSWKRLKDGREIDPDFYVEEGKDAEYKSSSVCERVYGWNGRMWPRISLHVYDGWNVVHTVSLNEPSLKLTHSYKSKQGQWWRTLDGVPLSLFEEAIEMMNEAKMKVSNGEK